MAMQIHRMAWLALVGQSRATPSTPPLARNWPFGLNATENMRPWLPVRGWPSAEVWAGSATFHSLTVASPLPLASVRPSGLKATER